jgi:hypothetical protein
MELARNSNNHREYIKTMFASEVLRGKGNEPSILFVNPFAREKGIDRDGFPLT